MMKAKKRRSTVRILPTVSGDGLFVGITSSATDLVSGNTNVVSDVFVTSIPLQ